MRNFLENRLIRGSGLLGGIALVLLGVVITADAASRSFGFALVGASEVGGVLLVCLIFFGISHTQLLRGHVAIEAIVSYMPKHIRCIAEAIALALCLTLTLLITWGTIRGAIDSYVNMEFQYGTMQFPLWPAKAVVALGFGLLALQQIIHLIEAIGTVFGKNPDPTEGRLPGSTI